MSLETDENGFVYFNDLLFKSMKLKYGEEHVRNKVLGFAETKTILKLNKLRKWISRSFWKNEKKAFSSANPFLAMMYYNKAYKKWKIWWHKNIERRQNEVKYELNRDSSDEEEVREEELLPDVFEEVEYEELNPEAEMEMKRQLIAQGI